MARTRLYRDGALVAQDFPAADLAEHLRDPAATAWLDLCAPTAAELAEVGDWLGLHELALEDAGHERQRPKLDLYDTHAFLTAHAVRLDEGSGKLVAAELAAFVTERALVTVRKDDAFDVDAVVARWDAAAGLAGSGVGFLLHGLLDHVVDSQFEAARALDDLVEDLEDELFTDRVDHTAVQRRSLALRRSLVLLRHAALPMREVVATLARREHGMVDRRMRPYFEDVCDHALRAAEWTDSLRELVATLRETQLNIQGYRLNTIMKRVTGWAAVIAVPTAVTGFYGQNVPYPGADQPWGFWMSTALLAVLSGGLYVLFKRRDWL